MSDIQLLQGDCLDVLATLPDGSVQTCVTSPPYFGLRAYLADNHADKNREVGTEGTPTEYVKKLVEVFRCVRDVLADDGTVWLNLGDSYAGSGKGRMADGTHQEGGKQGTSRGTIIGTLYKTPLEYGLKPKDLIGVPWRVAFALQADGWYLRSDIIWAKGNPMPESVTDRPTKAHEYIFLLAKSERYYYDKDAIKEPVAQEGRGSGNVERKVATAGQRSRINTHMGSSVPWTDDGTGRNKRSVWTVNTAPYAGAHFATFPPALIKPCILAGCPVGGTVLDPFAGSGTTLAVAKEHGRQAIGIELNPDYIALAESRLMTVQARLVV